MIEYRSLHNVHYLHLNVDNYVPGCTPYTRPTYPGTPCHTRTTHPVMMRDDDGARAGMMVDRMDWLVNGRLAGGWGGGGGDGVTMATSPTTDNIYKKAI